MEQWSRSTDATPNGRRSKALLFAVVLVAAGFAYSHPAAAAPRARSAPQPAPTPIPAPTVYGAVVPLGTKIGVSLTTEVSSATAKIGDNFQFKTRTAMKLGDLELPAGSPGHGRVAAVAAATASPGRTDGTLTLQADSVDLPDGTPIWVNIDDNPPIKGQYADKHTHVGFLEIVTTYSGNLVLTAGTPFSVVTIDRRAAPAPLVTAAPTPSPTGTPPAH